MPCFHCATTHLRCAHVVQVHCIAASLHRRPARLLLLLLSLVQAHTCCTQGSTAAVCGQPQPQCLHPPSRNGEPAINRGEVRWRAWWRCRTQTGVLGPDCTCAWNLSINPCGSRCAGSVERPVGPSTISCSTSAALAASARANEVAMAWSQLHTVRHMLSPRGPPCGAVQCGTPQGQLARWA